MQSGPFIKFIADLCRVEEKTVMVYARALKEAGMLTSGARGVNAPHMRPLDAARLVVALLATDRPAECVALVKRYMALPFRAEYSNGKVPESIQGGDQTLGSMLTRILALDPDPTTWTNDCDSARVAILRNEKTAYIFAGGWMADFRERGESSAEDRAARGGIWREHSLMTLELAVGLWADRFNGTDQNGYPLDIRHPWNAELSGDQRQKRLDEIHEFIRLRDADWREEA